MVDLAQKKGIFLMEALWTRFIPGTEKVLELIQNDKIGAIKLVKADFGFRAEYDTTKRLFNKKLGGGSLLDIGIYPVFLSLLTLGKPQNITAKAVMSPTQVDSTCSMIFEYENTKATLKSTLLAETNTEAIFTCEQGKLILNRQFHAPSSVKIITKEKEEELYNKIKNRYDNQVSPYYAAARIWTDAIISPLDTRTWISMGIDAANHAPIEKPFNLGVLQV